MYGMVASREPFGHLTYGVHNLHPVVNIEHLSQAGTVRIEHARTVSIIAPTFGR